ncbi:efflux RND transporter periplasmic adaptor subunit [Chenggangzhangella methanolivorans]|uniref:Efflux RND transporter periplasmic adaptor subunit n=1 Tax=Chenggangzhangella methanolivorans TaxID=1437009 RepID=A0A9E6RD97_9HYPH|nr:efflux RND transporter periplasmic adaptor subunit [Chenggangzhangella methanolivorans]QZN98940.1 efflux RND transporter periplasmic adaptor subunit [Chenggangzhangella methanolivorans]
MPWWKAGLRVALTLLVVAGGIAGGVYVWRAYMDDPWTRDGRVRADIVRLGADVSGAVTEVRIHDNEVVKKGDVLFVVDQARFRLALDLAHATEAGKQSDLEQKRREADRRDKLTSAALSEESKEQARAAVDAADAAMRAAVADRQKAELDLARTEVRAPVNGHVTNLLLRPGDYVSPGKAVVAIVDSDSFYVAGYFEETKIARIHTGDVATVRLMGRSDDLKGRVQSVARAIVDRDNAAGDDLIANVNPSFSWVRLAQRVPVRIKLDATPDDLGLTAGLTATVVITPSGAEGARQP